MVQEQVVSAETQLGKAALYFDTRIASWMAGNSVLLTRVALGIVFLWFGILKFFFPGQSPAEQLVSQTLFKLSAGHLALASTAGHIAVPLSLRIVAVWECLIGFGLLSGRFLRLTLLLLFLELPGMFLPLFLFPAEMWKHFGYVPTLTGQYIIKDIVLVCAGLLFGGTMRGGRVIADPRIADSAHRTQRISERFRRRFGLGPKLDAKLLTAKRS